MEGREGRSEMKWKEEVISVTNTQTDRQTDRQIDRHKGRHICI
jgi:hypothetical protein